MFSALFDLSCLAVAVELELPFMVGTRQTLQQVRRHASYISEDSKTMSEESEIKQSGLQRPVMAFMPGKISSDKYEQRVDNCTKDQLSLLLTSPDYQQWQQSKQAAKARSWKPSPELLLGLLCLVMLPLVALAPYYLPLHDQQVRTSCSKRPGLADDQLRRDYTKGVLAFILFTCCLRGDQVTSSIQQRDSASQPEASSQTQHPQFAEAANDFDVDKYITASNADVPDAWHIRPVSHTDQQHEGSAVSQQWTDNLESMPEEDLQHSSPLHGYVLTQDCSHATPRHAFLLLSYVL